MPFCRECGKQVEDDWASCPFCSQPIGSPESAMLGFQDSVVMGDINISKSGGEATPCSNCGASGSIKLACNNCKSHCTCELCVDDFRNNLDEEFIGSGRYEVNKLQKIHCRDCYVKHLNNKCRSICRNCKCKCRQTFTNFCKQCFRLDWDNQGTSGLFIKRKDIHASYHSQ